MSQKRTSEDVAKREEARLLRSMSNRQSVQSVLTSPRRKGNTGSVQPQPRRSARLSSPQGGGPSPAKKAPGSEPVTPPPTPAAPRQEVAESQDMVANSAARAEEVKSDQRAEEVKKGGEEAKGDEEEAMQVVQVEEAMQVVVEGGAASPAGTQGAPDAEEPVADSAMEVAASPCPETGSGADTGPPQGACLLDPLEEDLKKELEKAYPTQLHGCIGKHLAAKDSKEQRRVPIGLRNNITSFKTMKGLAAVAAAPAPAPAAEQAGSGGLTDSDALLQQELQKAYPSQLHGCIGKHLAAKDSKEQRRVPIGLRNNITSFKTMKGLPVAQPTSAVNGAANSAANGAANGGEDDEALIAALKQAYPDTLHGTIEEHSKGKGRRVPIGLRNNMESFKTMGQLNVGVKRARPASVELVGGKDDPALAKALEGSYPAQLHASITKHLKSGPAGSARVPIGLRNNITSFKTMQALPPLAVARPEPDVADVEAAVKSSYPNQLHGVIHKHLAADPTATSARIPIGLRNNIQSFKTMGKLPTPVAAQAGVKKPRKKPVRLADMAGASVQESMKTVYPQHLHGDLEKYLGSGERIPIGLRNTLKSLNMHE